MISRSLKNEKLEKELKEEEIKEKRHKRIWTFLKIFCGFLIFIIILISYMHFISTKGLVVREYKIESSLLPESFHGFKVVHFSDLHYLTTIHEKEVNNLVNKINKLKPDIVVFTGDLVDRRKIATEKDLKVLTDALNKIEVTTGLYAIKGNHDYANDYFDKVFTNTKFKILNNNYELIYYKGSTPILLTGMGSILHNDCDIDLAYSFSEIDNLYTISIFHEPDVIDNIVSRYHTDLALTGHSHNGQVRLPGIGAIIKVEEGKKYSNEKYVIGNTSLFVSGGIGTSKYEIRFFNKPSINLYRLTKEAN